MTLYALVEVNRQGIARVSVFDGQYEAVRLTGVKSVYIDYRELRSPGLWLVNVHSVASVDDAVHITTPAQASMDNAMTLTMNALDRAMRAIPEIAKEILRSQKPSGEW